MVTRDVKIRIGATDTASKVFKRVAIAAGAFLSLRVLGRAAKQSLSLFAEQEKATQKLEQAILATGGALGFTVQQMREYAGELQNMTTISNESFEEAISVMATFRNVSGDAFKRSIELAADMSIALGTDLKGSVILLGKALNDTKIGISALTRVGITFSDTQKELITQLTEQNDLLGAQTVILDEIFNQFGGQARKAADGYSGSIDQIINSWDDAKKKLGETIATAPVIDLQNNIRLTTILIENMGLTWDLILTQMAAKATKAAIRIQALSPFGAAFLIKNREAIKQIMVSDAQKIAKLQEELAAPLAERLSALIPMPDPDRLSKRQREIDEAFREARLSARLTAGARPGAPVTFEDRIAAARAGREPLLRLTPTRQAFPTDAEREARFGPQRMRGEGRQRIREMRESIELQKKEGTRSDKAIELQEEILRALEGSEVIQVTNFN